MKHPQPVLLEEIFDVHSYNPAWAAWNKQFEEAMALYEVFGDTKTCAVHMGVHKYYFEGMIAYRGKETPTAYAILRLLIDNYPRAVYLDEFVEMMYPDPDDMPLDPKGTVRVFFSKIRPCLKPGWRIKSRYERGVELVYDEGSPTATVEDPVPFKPEKRVEATKNITFSVPLDVAEELQQIAKSAGINRQELVRQMVEYAIDDALDETEENEEL